jgi:hypothetical protein
MIHLPDTVNTNRFTISLDGDELLAIMRALYWYEDRLTNMQRSKGRDDMEWDIVMYLRQQLCDGLKKDAFIN